MSNEPRAHATALTNTESQGGQPPSRAAMNASFPSGFEEDDDLRSEFIRQLADRSLPSQQSSSESHSFGHTHAAPEAKIPRTLIRFWHDSHRIPADVQACLDSWEPLRGEGVTFCMFDDDTAATYISDHYGAAQVAAFARCEHPAMRSDYLRLCVILAEGGLYVDADDVLLDHGWRRAFRDNRLKLQPLCYDILKATMVPATEVGLFERPTSRRIFYLNNNPIAAPPNHPVLKRALARATRLLLDPTRVPEIQSTTGPGNMTAALAAQANGDLLTGRCPDLNLLFDWEATARPDWNLAYRHDDRNWRKQRDWHFTKADRQAGNE